MATLYTNVLVLTANVWRIIVVGIEKEDTENVKIAIAESSKDNKLVLAIRGMEYSGWFRFQKQKFLKDLEIMVNENKKQWTE